MQVLRQNQKCGHVVLLLKIKKIKLQKLKKPAEAGLNAFINNKCGTEIFYLTFRTILIKVFDFYHRVARAHG